MMFTPIPTDIIIGNFLSSPPLGHMVHILVHIFLLFQRSNLPSFITLSLSAVPTDSDGVPLLQIN